ncbi:MAG: polysaccharide biosynthesis/export family protein [Thermodesulfovibrionales bacterium]|jgi:polysaccharide export outer membrane protein
MNIFFRGITAVGLVSALLYGCSGTRDVNVQNANTELTKKNTMSEKLNDMMLKSALTQSTDPNADYIIGAEDLLDIDVFQAEELKRTVRVSSQGYIGLPLIGQIKAKGLTPLQLEQEIAAKLEEYMEEPLVTVFVKEYKAQKIGVIGAVANPQVYSVVGQKRLLDMLSMAGGLSKESAGTVAYILRPANTEQGGLSRTETLVIDLTELLEKGNIALNVPVFSGDVINVPKGGVIFVDGAVNKSGAFPLQGGRTSLVKVIAMAEGLKFEADRSDIKIFRENGEGLRDVITVDYDAVNEGKQKDVLVKENDIVIVPKSGMKNFLSGFMSAIKGLVTVGREF